MTSYARVYRFGITPWERYAMAAAASPCEAAPVDLEQSQAQRIHQQIIPPEPTPPLHQARRQNQTDPRRSPSRRALPVRVSGGWLSTDQPFLCGPAS
jgi:hypothetical protein